MPRCPRVWSLTALLLCATALPAQDLPESVSHAMIDGALRALQVRPARKNEAYRFALEGRELTLTRLDNGGRLLVQGSVASRPPLEVVNRYNEQFAVTTRAVRYGTENVVLEAGLDCRLGVSETALRKFVAGFAKELQGFEKFLAGQPAAVAPKAVLNPGVADAGPADAGQPQPAVKPIPIRPIRPIPGQPVPQPGQVQPPVAQQPSPLRITPGSDDRELEITFPTKPGEEGETSWRILWDIENGEQAINQGYKFPKSRKNAQLLFKIKKAYFKPGAKAEWIQVLEDAHPQEFYVPYYFQNTRFFDLRDVGNYVRLNANEGSQRSRLLGKQQMVMAELRDRGLAYKHGNITRRAEELTLWANFQAGNYTYLVEFGFQDDGTIAMRHAPTGYNYYDHFDSASHMHNCLWRIGVRLAPAGSAGARNDVQLVKLPPGAKQQGPAGKLEIVDVKSECGIDWEAKEFTKLRVTNPEVSVFPVDGKRPRMPISYDLVATVQGVARHARNKDEGFSQHDFWVTRPDGAEKMYIYLHKQVNGQTPPRPLEGNDGVVLWHMSSGLHIPRGEDGILTGNNLSNGQALVSWTVVELRPRNLFTRTPMYRKGS